MKSSTVVPVSEDKEEKPSRIVAAALQRPAVHRSLWQHLAKGLGIQLEGAVATNEVSTAKYTIITFLPVNLFEQFMRVANMYFLLCAVLQLIPKLSPTSWFTTVAPLVFVLAVNAVKEGFDDYHRHRNDNQLNTRTVLRLTEGDRTVPTCWRDVVAGDVLKVKGAWWESRAGTSPC
jgi:magnesium-transporting ATPase (P-type)